MSYDLSIEHPSLYCPNVNIRCKPLKDVCKKGLEVIGQSSGASGGTRGPKISLLNSFAISYSRETFHFEVSLDSVNTDGFGQVFATFSDESLTSTCAKY